MEIPQRSFEVICIVVDICMSVSVSQCSNLSSAINIPSSWWRWLVILHILKRHSQRVDVSTSVSVLCFSVVNLFWCNNDNYHMAKQLCQLDMLSMVLKNLHFCAQLLHDVLQLSRIETISQSIKLANPVVL